MYISFLILSFSTFCTASVYLLKTILIIIRYGSVVLFHCDIQHAGRPPTAYNTVARYSFAVKVARTKLDAVSTARFDIHSQST